MVDDHLREFKRASSGKHVRLSGFVLPAVTPFPEICFWVPGMRVPLYCFTFSFFLFFSRPPRSPGRNSGSLPGRHPGAPKMKPEWTPRICFLEGLRGPPDRPKSFIFSISLLIKCLPLGFGLFYAKVQISYFWGGPF